MQYATFPMKYARVSCRYNQSTAHIKCSTGKPADYPTDLVGADTGRDWLYAPCDMVVLRKYTQASHAIWLRSVDKVHTPYGDGYLLMMSEHQVNSEMGAVGHIYKKGEKMFREGASGNATGNHLHVSFAFSKTKASLGGSGWKRNSKGAWVLYSPNYKNIKIQQALYLDNSFTTKIGDIKSIKFKAISQNKDVDDKQVSRFGYIIGHSYALKEKMNVRISYGTDKPLTKTKTLPKNTKVVCKDVVKHKNALWMQTSKGWICAVGSTGKKFIK